MKTLKSLRVFIYLLSTLALGWIMGNILFRHDPAGFSSLHHYKVAVEAYAQPANPATQNGHEVHVIEATYGDKTSGKVCIPNLEICKHTSGCEFTVTDGLCEVDAPRKILEVVWDCGPGTDIKTRNAAKGTKMVINCGN
ncbi:MAG: hypothetical protein U0V70_12835 [Terriglobia bacterium]